MQESCQGGQGRDQTPPWACQQLPLVLVVVLLLLLVLVLVLVLLLLLPRQRRPAASPLPQHGWPPRRPPTWLPWG